tara:strand:+ start:104 stop:409 length:306 start_codon:yes stop_codon:yes gene_type:complete
VTFGLGINQPLNSSNLFQAFIGDISAKSLMAFKWTCFGQVSGVFNPAVNSSVFYIQGINLLFLIPTLIYNISDDWELMLTTQSSFGEINSKSKAASSVIFL